MSMCVCVCVCECVCAHRMLYFTGFNHLLKDLSMTDDDRPIVTTGGKQGESRMIAHRTNRLSMMSIANIMTSYLAYDVMGLGNYLYRT